MMYSMVMEKPALFSIDCTLRDFSRGVEILRMGAGVWYRGAYMTVLRTDRNTGLTPGGGSMHYLGICAIIRDETPFLEEWMAYYLHLGVEAFYLYDNESKVPVRETLARYSSWLGPKRLVIHNAPGTKLQMATYGHCVAAYGSRCRWIAFVDLDEFIVPLRRDSIPEMLEEFESYAGLALHWRLFGSNGHNRRPEGATQLELFTRAINDDPIMSVLVKGIMNPAAVDYFPTPHHCVVKEGAGHTVRVDHEPIYGPCAAPPLWVTGQVNHYYYRAKQDYYAKLRKPRPDLQTVRGIPKKVVTPPGDEEDLAALRFLPGVKRIIGKMRE